MIWGKSDLIRYNLSLLYRFIKVSIETGKPCTHIPIPLWKILNDKDDKSSNQTVESLFENSSTTSDEDLGKFSTEEANFLIDNLEKSTLPDTARLIAFIKAFNEVFYNVLLIYSWSNIKDH